MTVVLGIETSCDETAIALVRSDHRILAEKNPSQSNIHNLYGGIVPEISSRLHLEMLKQTVQNTCAEASMTSQQIDAIAVTGGPGLMGGLIVGVMFAKSLAAAWRKPFLAINHLEGHALTVRLTHQVNFPYLLLLASGGHCQFLLVEDVGDYHLLGSTLDDSVGETFDKTARLMGLSYPGGPIIEQLALGGDASRFSLPRPLKGRPGCNFSFSGLKSSVARCLESMGEVWYQDEKRNQQDLSASFQAAVGEIMVDRLHHAISIAKKQRPDLMTFVMAGGVASNQFLCSMLSQTASTEGLILIAPPPHLCTDNGSMIAWAGIERLRLGNYNELDFNPKPRWPLDQRTAV